MDLPDAERRDALAVAASNTGRSAHLLEKDVWVVWCLDALFSSPLGEHLVFKGGTSLSKVYGAIRRFSEDVDLTYDIRAIAPDIVKTEDSNPVPPTRGQSRKWTNEVRERLPNWVREHALPTIRSRLEKDGLAAKIEADGDKIRLSYDPLEKGTGYVSPVILLEFGARSSGEPSELHRVACDAAPHLATLEFPSATPRTMKAERTFWEKATAIHVYCSDGKLRGDRIARHWYDIVRLDDLGTVKAAVADRKLAQAVAEHKGWSFAEKDGSGAVIDYAGAVAGHLKLVPEGDHRSALQKDYRLMIEDGLFFDQPETFDELMKRCETIQTLANEAGGATSPPGTSAT